MLYIFESLSYFTTFCSQGRRSTAFFEGDVVNYRKNPFLYNIFLKMLYNFRFFKKITTWGPFLVLNPMPNRHNVVFFLKSRKKYNIMQRRPVCPRCRPVPMSARSGSVGFFPRHSEKSQHFPDHTRITPVEICRCWLFAPFNKNQVTVFQKTVT